MYDLYNREISYLRISVTDRCNLRCQYCMPETGVELLSHNDVLSFEEIVEVVKVAVEQGITKIRLTGGEPLVRKGIVSLVQQIAAVEGVNDLSMTTNGVLLTEFATELKEAGLHRLNISLDTLNPQKFRELTRIGDLDKVLNGIQAAKKAGFSKIKINTVINSLTDDTDIHDLKKFCADNAFEIRFIRQMNRETGEYHQVEGGDGGNCQICNRIRLSSNGYFLPCLFGTSKFSIKEFGVKESLIKAINNKPLNGCEKGFEGLFKIGG